MVADALVGPDVGSAQRLVERLDESGSPVRAALWVFDSDTNAWRLWLAFSHPPDDKRAFYELVGAVISRHRSELGGLDVGDVRAVAAEHPALLGLRGMMSVDGLKAVHLSDNLLNGYFLPSSVILRMT